MPLMKSKSKKAFEANIKTEMHAGKPQPQALAIAYGVKRRAKKASGGTVESGSSTMNMTDGGAVNAKNQKRPMPENTYNDAHNVSRNSARKPVGSDWSDASALEQSRSKGGMKPQKHPRMVEGILSTKLRDQEGRLIESMSPDGYENQPDSEYNERDAKKQGSSPNREPEHSTGRMPYAKGGKIQPSDSESHNAYKHTNQEPKDHEIQERNRLDESDLMDKAAPSEDEGAMNAKSRNEEGQNRQGPDAPDLHMKMMADGGEMSRTPTDSMDQPEPEQEEEHHASMAAAIMARRKRLHEEVDSGAHDMDEASMYAEGGYLNGEESIYSDDADQADLARNAEEDMNLEDQSSFDAMRKENYSESEGLSSMTQPNNSNLKGDSEESDSENKRDRVSAIRSKMKSRR